MDSKSEPSAAAVKELLDSMKALHQTKNRWDVVIISTHQGVDYQFKAHTAIICPRSKFFASFRPNNKGELIDGHPYWHIGDWSPSVVEKMLQYLYELNYEVDSQEGTPPDLSTHVELWSLGNHLRIKGLKSVAANKFKPALSQFSVYGSEVGFKISYFEELVAIVETVWGLKPDPTGVLRNQISIHIQQNIKEWRAPKGPQSGSRRFLESMYRLIFHETEQQSQNFTELMEKVRANYQQYLWSTESECGWRK